MAKSTVLEKERRAQAKLVTVVAGKTMMTTEMIHKRGREKK